MQNRKSRIIIGHLQVDVYLSPRPLVTLRFRHRLMLVFAYAADVEFRASILPRGSRRADEADGIIWAGCQHGERCAGTLSMVSLIPVDGRA